MKLNVKMLVVALLLIAGKATAQELYADFINLQKRPNLVDSIMYLSQMDDAMEEDYLFPEMDLEENWDTERINPYKVDVSQLPDAIDLNVSNFAIPIVKPTYVTSHFGYRPKFRRYHYGTDLKLRTGDTVCAAFSGKIRIRKFDRRGYGYYLVIRHDNGLETVYGHLSRFLVQMGDVVKAGQPIALGGNTGRSYGAHLHFETRFMGKAFDATEIFDFNLRDVYGDKYVFHVKSKGLGTSKPAPINKERPKAGAPLNALAVDNSSKSPNSATTTSTSGTSSVAAVKQTTITPKSASNQDGISTYRVQKNDYLDKIAKSHNTSVKKICELNGITVKTKLQIGQVLRVS